MSINPFTQILAERKGYASLREKRRKDINYRISRMVSEARIIKNISQKDLARKIGTKQPAIARLESGKTTPSLSLLIKIASALETYLIPPKFAFMKDIEDEHDMSATEFFVKDLNTHTHVIEKRISISLSKMGRGALPIFDLEKVKTANLIF
jgi:transcriptional regulator with XRE-family HTH domain